MLVNIHKYTIHAASGKDKMKTSDFQQRLVFSGEVWMLGGHPIFGWHLRTIHCSWKYFVHHCFVLPEILGIKNYLAVFGVWFQLVFLLISMIYKDVLILKTLQVQEENKNRYPTVPTYQNSSDTDRSTVLKEWLALKDGHSHISLPLGTCSVTSVL